MNPPVTEKVNVHMFWAYGQLSQIEHLSLNSFIANGFNVNLWSYDKIKNAHPKTILRDAREILHEDRVFRYKCGGLQGFSNFFRYSIYKKFSGLYSDLDVVALKSYLELPKEPFLVTQRSPFNNRLIFLKNLTISKLLTQFILTKKKLGLNSDTLKEFSKRKNPEEFLSNWISIKQSYLMINNNLFYNPSPKSGDIIDLARAFSENYPIDLLEFGDTGPHYLTLVVKKFPKLSFQIMEPDFANPLDVFDFRKAFLNNYKVNPKSFFIHLWNSQFKKLSSDLNLKNTFPKGSLLDNLAKKYL